MNTVGKRLRLLRGDLEMTANDVITACAAIGVFISKSAYNRYELDRALPQSDSLAALAKVLGTSTEYLSMAIGNPVPILDIEENGHEHQHIARRIMLLSARDREILNALIGAMEARNN